MTIVHASSLSDPDLRSLGNNLLPAIEADQQASDDRPSRHHHDEHRERLYRRSGHTRAERLRRRVGA